MLSLPPSVEEPTDALEANLQANETKIPASTPTDDLWMDIEDLFKVLGVKIVAAKARYT